MRGILQSVVLSNLALNSTRCWKHQTHPVINMQRYLTAQLVLSWVSSTCVNSFSNWDQYGLGFCNLRPPKCIEQALLFVRICSGHWDCATKLARCFSECDLKMLKRSIGLHVPLLTHCLACIRAHTELYSCTETLNFFLLFKKAS